MLNKVYNTNKLFFNKFLYCISIPNGLAPIFRDKEYISARKILDILHLAQDQRTNKEMHLSAFYLYKLPAWIHNNLQNELITQDHLFDATVLFQALNDPNNDFKSRICWTNNTFSNFSESSTLRLYSNQKDKLLTICKKTRSLVDFYCPHKDNLEVLKSNPNTILCKKNDYKYKIVFNHKKISNSFVTWYLKNKNKVKVSNQCLHDVKKYGNLDNRHILVRDENTLMVLNIILQPNIRKIYHLVCSDNLDK